MRAPQLAQFHSTQKARWPPAERCHRANHPGIVLQNTQVQETCAYLVFKLSTKVASSCGLEVAHLFYEANAAEQLVKVKDMQYGDVCSYEVISACGAPSFKLLETSEILKDQFGIVFLEFADAFVDLKAPVTNRQMQD